jgi:UDP-N-acetylglucosamine/UDP-N-acetylgalactosamine diphosphorylase
MTFLGAFFSESHSSHSTEMDELRQKLEKYGQGHLLDFWEKITEDQQKTLKTELDNLDLEYTTQSFERCIEEANNKAKVGKVDGRMNPVPSKDTRDT